MCLEMENNIDAGYICVDEHNARPWTLHTMISSQGVTFGHLVVELSTDEYSELLTWMCRVHEF